AWRVPRTSRTCCRASAREGGPRGPRRSKVGGRMFQGDRRGDAAQSTQTGAATGAPGKQTLIDELVQRRATAASAASDAEVHAAAADGLAGPSTALPHLDAIQASFGDHDVRGVHAHVGGAATDASERMGAQAYASGGEVAFASAPDLHTAAHEAAHVV